MKAVRSGPGCTSPKVTCLNALTTVALEAYDRSIDNILFDATRYNYFRFLLRVALAKCLWIQGPNCSPVTEGGDIILVGNGKDVLVGVEKYSTDMKGFKWLQQALEPDGYQLHPVFFDMYEIHLLAQLNLIRPGLGIRCGEAFKNHPPLPEVVRDWEYIDITVDEVHKGGADVVMLDENRAIVSAQQPRLADELAKRDIELILVNISRAAEGASGPRCQMIIIHREKSTLSL